MSDFHEASPEVRWYVAHTYSGYENKVRANLLKIIENRGLQDKIKEIRIPVQVIESPEDEEVVDTPETTGDDKNGKAKDKKDKKDDTVLLFPSYVLIKMIMTDETWHVVRNIRGVTGFVGPGSKPVPLTDEEVAAMGIEVRTIELGYKVGDSVRILAEAFKGYVGVVAEISDDKKKIIVMASLQGREIPVEIDSDGVELIK